MKEFFYRLFALFFAVSRLLPVKENRVALVSMHNEGFNDSLGSVRGYLQKQGGYELIYINKRDLSFQGVSSMGRILHFFLVSSRQLATSKYVFLNDNFLPMSMLNFREDTVVTQLWHAEGVFKRFGLSIPQPQKLRKRELQANERLSYVVCSSENVRKHYAEAFGVPAERVLALGSPRTDSLYDRRDLPALREKFTKAFPGTRGKKLVLYAPTFRDDEQADRRLLDSFPVETLKNRLGDEYELLIRLHPQLHAGKRDFDAIDLTDYPDPTELVLLCDVLITDYSSICMDFALLNKPTVFYAFDLEQYSADRSFYYDYESYVPGAVAKTPEELTELFKRPFDMSKTERFRCFNFDSFDGRAAERVVKYIMKS